MSLETMKVRVELTSGEVFERVGYPIQMGFGRNDFHHFPNDPNDRVRWKLEDIEEIHFESIEEEEG